MDGFKIPKACIALIALGATAGSTSVSEPIDCMRFSYLSLDVYGSSVAATSNRPSVLKLTESDSTDATTFADIVELVGDGTGGFIIPAWHTNSATRKVVKMSVDLRARKRFLRLSVSPRVQQDFVVVANLLAGEVT